MWHIDGNLMRTRSPDCVLRPARLYRLRGTGLQAWPMQSACTWDYNVSACHCKVSCMNVTHATACLLSYMLCVGTACGALALASYLLAVLSSRARPCAHMHPA